MRQLHGHDAIRIGSIGIRTRVQEPSDDFPVMILTNCHMERRVILFAARNIWVATVMQQPANASERSRPNLPDSRRVPRRK